MRLALSEAQVTTLWEHLSTRLYNVMHVRNKFKNGTLLGGIALVDGSIIGMFSFNNDYFEFKVSFVNGKPEFLVRDTIKDEKLAALIESRLATYIQNRIEQEREMDSEAEKFSPRYKDGEVYLRRRKNSPASHAINLAKAAESRAVNFGFADRLAGMNLVIRFKPKH